MTNKSDEMCANCIYWDGDSNGDQGPCTNDAGVIVGRFESCVNFLNRFVPHDDGEWREEFGLS